MLKDNQLLVGSARKLSKYIQSSNIINNITDSFNKIGGVCAVSN
jgi:hypothetical protein